MAQNDNSAINKKISDLTFDEINALKKPVGIPGLPYPMAMLSKNNQGVMVHDVGLIESYDNPLIVYSKQNIERVTGRLFREMPTPSMMLMMRDLLAKIDPHSKNRIMTVFGDAAAGKSHIFRLIGTLTHERGPIVVDCGGMNMRELFFRTVIDYGHGVKEQLEKRAVDGKILKSSLETLEGAFPGSVIEKDGKVLINWDAVGARATKLKEGTTNEFETIESYDEAAYRAKKILDGIYAKEGISVQTNAFGIKTVKGEVFESIETGRPLFLDEFNKSKKGTLDAFQTFLQFANGEIDTVTIYNPMAEAGEGDSPKAITINRSDLRSGWHIGVAGNDTTDGDTTQDLSLSMETRLNIVRIGEPEKPDWCHRVSQIWTGLPLVTLYNLNEEKARANPAEFAEWLIGLRTLGLNNEEIQAIPPHELHFLRNFDKTVQAINQVSNYYYDRLLYSNQNSEKYNTKDKKILDMADEIAMGGKRIHVSFRKAIDDFNKAMQNAPEVRGKKQTTLSFNLSDVFNKAKVATIGENVPGWHRFGVNMVRAIVEGIVNDSTGMEKTQNTLLQLAESNGVVIPEYKEGKASGKMTALPELMKFDDLEKFGGTKYLTEVRSVLMAYLKEANAKTPITVSDDNVIGLANLGVALEKLNAAGGTPFVMPNNDLNTVGNTPLIKGEAVPIYLYDDSTYEGKLADFRMALAALTVPGYAKDNLDRIWPKDMLDWTVDKPTAAENLAYDVICGRSADNFNMNVLETSDEKGKATYLYVVEDRVADKRIVLGDNKISDQLQSALMKNGVSYIVRSENGARDKVNGFLSDGVRARGSDKQQLTAQKTQAMTETLIQAFTALGVDEGRGSRNVAKGNRLGDLLCDAKGEPRVHIKILAPK